MNTREMKSALVLCLALALAVYVGTASIRDFIFPGIGKLETLLSEDLQNLKATVPELSQISSYVLEDGEGDELAHKWVQNIRWPKANPNGQYIAEVLLLSQTFDGNLQAIVQISILDRTSKNLVEEIGRTYTLK